MSESRKRDRDRDRDRGRDRDRRSDRSESPPRKSLFASQQTAAEQAAASAQLGAVMAAQAAAMSGNGKPLPNMNGLLALRGETADQKRSRELFIGNLPAPAPTEFQLKDFLSAAVQQAGMCTMPGTSLFQIRIQKKNGGRTRRQNKRKHARKRKR